MPNVAEVSVDIEFTDGLHLPKHGIDHYVSPGSSDSRTKNEKTFLMNTKMVHFAVNWFIIMN